MRHGCITNLILFYPAWSFSQSFRSLSFFQEIVWYPPPFYDWLSISCCLASRSKWFIPGSPPGRYFLCGTSHLSFLGCQRSVAKTRNSRWSFWGGVTRRSSFSKKRRFRKVVFPQLEGPTTKMLKGDLNVKPCSTQLMIQMKHMFFIQKLLFRSLQYLPRCPLLCHRYLQDHA